MHSYLVVGGAPDQRIRFVESLLEDHGVEQGLDTRYLLDSPTTSIGIDAVRQAKMWLGRAAHDRRVCLVPNANRLTQAAQHALLKAMEEPEANTIFLLSAPSEFFLLPTLRSRCTIRRIRKTPQETSSEFPEWMAAVISQRTVGRRMAFLSQDDAARRDPARFLDELIERLFELTVSVDCRNKPPAHLLRAAVRTRGRLDAQCSPTLALGQFLLDIPFSS